MTRKPFWIVSAILLALTLTPLLTRCGSNGSGKTVSGSVNGMKF